MVIVIPSITDNHSKLKALEDAYAKEFKEACDEVESGNCTLRDVLDKGFQNIELHKEDNDDVSTGFRENHFSEETLQRRVVFLGIRREPDYYGMKYFIQLKFAN